MPRPRLIAIRLAFGLAAIVATPAAQATPVIERSRSCEAFVDPREIRLRVPDRVVIGRIVPGSLHEPETGPVEIGEVILFGTGTLAPGDGTPPLAISYFYVREAGCTGWAPGSGARFVFDLIDDHAANGVLRVMRYAPAAR